MLLGVSVVNAVRYLFLSNTTLQPGNFVVLASNSTAFAARYGVAPTGEYFVCHMLSFI